MKKYYRLMCVFLVIYTITTFVKHYVMYYADDKSFQSLPDQKTVILESKNSQNVMYPVDDKAFQSPPEDRKKSILESQNSQNVLYPVDDKAFQSPPEDRKKSILESQNSQNVLYPVDDKAFQSPPEDRNILVYNKNHESLDGIRNLIWKQIEELQEHGNCEEKKILFCTNRDNYAGFGSMVHRYGVCMQTAFGLGRIWFINQKQYDHFGGFNAFLKPESDKCGYLKDRYKNQQAGCNMQHKRCYPNGYDIDESHKVLEYTSSATFPHPRHIPRTIPSSIEKALKKLNVTQPWLWLTSQFLGYLLLRHNTKLTEKIKLVSKQLDLRQPYVAMHVRRGDKITRREAFAVDEEEYIKEAESYFKHIFKKPKVKHVYIASDQQNMIDVVRTKRQKLQYENYKLSVLSNRSSGNYFAGKFKKEILEDVLIDLYFLTHANYTICTFSSNIGRLVYALKQSIPPYNAVDHIVSMDMPKTMVYQWYGYYDYWLELYWVTTESNTQEKPINGRKLLRYDRGQLFEFVNETYTYIQNGKPVVLAYGQTKYGLNGVQHGYVYRTHIKKWPGNPKYYFYT